MLSGVRSSGFLLPSVATIASQPPITLQLTRNSRRLRRRNLGRSIQSKATTIHRPRSSSRRLRFLTYTVEPALSFCQPCNRQLSSFQHGSPATTRRRGPTVNALRTLISTLRQRPRTARQIARAMSGM
ncbi:hypothetical protein PF005_g30574 [Phytophthora fragariae]|uniref:Uncharacterized protein n=1 Tax=Phytophthora fragariae TaxID=53985 RepID=A0A6A3GY39_9STRA|nr:hypothetical protein PF003_g34726 [Phytophthora fragariae]KAE8881194.1 hypothetical protein PF003_g34736 [Phytophthora fragariae]KAE8921132.1 hypothetical protein PF009_g28583 [Phytophthora fragariae]KAE8961904.1 hypothetical protein PF011_g29578 [Phytophthora fragariae]KAE9067142.1 hypothetical protein PF007_g28184 [Phytophthora fragariae]